MLHEDATYTKNYCIKFLWLMWNKINFLFNLLLFINCSWNTTDPHVFERLCAYYYVHILWPSCYGSCSQKTSLVEEVYYTTSNSKLKYRFYVLIIILYSNFYDLEIRKSVYSVFTRIFYLFISKVRCVWKYKNKYLRIDCLVEGNSQPLQK